MSKLEKQGNELEAQYKFADAIRVYEQIIEKQPSNGSIQNQIAVCYFKQGQFLQAIDALKKVLRIKNDIPDVYNNLSSCYVNLRQYKKAETALMISLKLKVNNGTHFALGNLYFYMKQYDKSIFHYKEITILKTNTSYLYNLGFSYLAKKRFLKGFSLYENRLHDNSIDSFTNQIKRVEIPWIPFWDGKQPYSHLLVIYEQGIGDNLQYYRFILELSQKYPDRKITYFCKNTVAHLFQKCLNVDVVLNIHENYFDYKVFIMSLPYCLQIKEISPCIDNYIQTNFQKDIFWKNYFSTHYSNRPFKIGFVNNGLLNSFIEKNISLEEWGFLGDFDQVSFICLGKDISKEEKKGCAKNISFLEIDNDLPFQDTASILPLLDVFITVDTAIAHLAGVMKIKTWLLLGYGSDWRWFSNTEYTSIWYSSAFELIRMQENKDMKELLPIVKQRLEHLTNDSSRSKSTITTSSDTQLVL
jgi:tetratricopeptide (TPR) repeat protein